MNPQIDRMPVSALNDGSNIRSDLGTEADLRRLGKSLGKRQQQPLLILADGTVIDGHRRLAAARLAGIEELDCIVIGEDITPAEIEQIQLISAVHRADLPAYDKAVAVRDIEAAHPNMTRKALAEDILDYDPAMVTKFLALFDSCIPAVQDAAREGKIGVTDWYAISRADDQAAALARALNGATRADLEHENRKRRNGNGQPAVRMPRIKIPLANDIATGTVTVAGEEDIDLEAAETLLKEAMKAVRQAKEKALDTKTAQAVWRDMAKAGG